MLIEVFTALMYFFVIVLTASFVIMIIFLVATFVYCLWQIMKAIIEDLKYDHPY
jgi:hypothetical protein